MATASEPEVHRAPKGKLTTWWSKVIQCNPAGLYWARGVLVLDIALVPLIVLWATGYEQYLLSALFGLLFSVVADPGGSFPRRVSHTALFGLIGAGLTALGFYVGAQSWGWLALAAFAITLVAGLAAAFGAHRYASALLLNIWFVIALAVSSGLHHDAHISSYTWAQTAAWSGGAALWIAASFLEWLIRGRSDRPPPVQEIPGDTARRKLTAPMVVYAAVRALVMFGTVALAFGLELSHGLWLPIAAIIAMKPSLEQSALVGAQRLIGAAVGAVAAALLLLIPASEHGAKLLVVERGLEMVALVLFMHAVAVRFWNYAAYTAAVAAGVLILMDLPQPSDYQAEGYRVLWTFCGVAIGVLVMLLTGLLGKRRAHKAAPVSPSQSWSADGGSHRPVDQRPQGGHDG
ncbi:FUSC family protein [Uniformispora flossi]|uniref:FUSC family protein n=1 Tax=Uniformispora flossi TaxID=3390723 RepID=UPI003C2BCC67